MMSPGSAAHSKPTHGPMHKHSIETVRVQRKIPLRWSNDIAFKTLTGTSRVMACEQMIRAKRLALTIESHVMACEQTPEVSADSFR